MIPARIARLNADGSTDTSFSGIGTGANAVARCVAIRADGKIVVGGDFTAINGEGLTRLTVRETDGSADPGFSATANNSVHAIETTSDGKALLGGAFTSISGSARNRSARLSADGTLEPAYNPNVDGTVYALANQEDGKILIGGQFTVIGGTSRVNFGRLMNDSAISTLTVQSATTVFWERTGSTPETEQVIFELSTDGGMSYTLLGYGSSVLGGWQLTGLSLSGDGILRARALTPSGSAQGIVEESVSFDFVPEIQVEQPEGSILTDGSSTVAYDSVQVGSTQDLTFYIRNIGLADLTLTGGTPVALSGANANQWSILAQPSSPVVPNGVSSFTLRFVPTSAGAKTAVLTILSDDSDEGTFTVNLTGTATPGPGSYDDTFQPVANNTIYAAAIDMNNRVSVGGAFTTLNGLTRNRFGRLLSDGTSDFTLTGTAANNLITAIAVQPDGSFLVGGSFTSFNGTTRNRIARISANGTLDTTFNPNANGVVAGIEVQADGRIVVCGGFSSIGGTSRNGICRLFSNGTVDTSFGPVTPATSSFVNSITQADGSIIAHRRQVLYKFLYSGVVDSSYGSSTGIPVTGQIIAMVQQPDGKVIVGGAFPEVGGVSKTNLARINTDGTVDSAFTATLNGAVGSIALQTDGKIFITGNFTTINGNSHIGFGRLNSDGTEDTSYVSTTSPGSVQGVTLQEDGKPVLVGDFAVSGVGSGIKIARFINTPASEEITVPDASTIQWLRSGTSPEAVRVKFQFSQDSGSTWQEAGNGERVTGGWAVASANLPTSGIARGLAWVPGAYQTGSFSLLESQVTFSGLPAPDLQLEQPANTIIADNGSKQFPGRLPSQSATLIFTLRNTGLANLTGISAISTNPAEFEVITLSSPSIVPGGTATLEIRFTPANTGSRTAALSIISNVPGNKNPYSINLSGNGIATPLATTLSAQSVTSTTALLRGSFTARDDIAYAYWQYRIGSLGAWTTVPMTPLTLSGFSAQTLTTGLTGLTPSTGYQFRAVIYNSVTGAGSPVTGSNLSFTTLA